MQTMDEVYREYAGYVFRYLCALTGSEDLAQELTQETFYQAVKSVDRFDGRSGVSTWLCGIAKNCLRVYRRKNPAAAELTEEAFPVPAPSAEAEAEANDDDICACSQGCLTGRSAVFSAKAKTGPASPFTAGKKS